ncbi:putative DNA-binding protein (MmcQ/YjbR family) [Nakamurella sp. UYEF19]|uniref:MmcQ/YjbR family DNA-binding protein n=1 Tax=Nakamurella sp. UYEF19 TaxID=1756392 RepID=UPI003393FC83
MSLTLPGSTVKPSHGSAAYQVRSKSFAMAMSDHHGNGRVELWVKGAPDTQQEWVAGNGDRYYVPPYVGPSGWIGVWLDRDVEWPAVAELLVEGYLVQAGRRAVAALDPTVLVADVLSGG